METVKRDTDHPTGLPPLRVATAPHGQEDNRLKDELLTVLLHDLRSPVGAVGVLTDLLSTILNRGEMPDTRQLKLLKESVAKTQRVLDDAVEIQSIIRGSSTLNLTMIDLDLLVETCIAKVRQASFFRNVTMESQVEADRLFVNVDLDKMESVLLCLLEHSIAQVPGSAGLRFSASRAPGVVILHIAVIEKPSGPHDRSASLSAAERPALRGRLGTRRPGESRYSFQICCKVLNLMGGQIAVTESDLPGLEIRLPAAINS